MTRVAVVTGANQGIGLQTVRVLCKEFNGDVYLTARSHDKGLAAVSDLQKEGLKPMFHQLDITDHGSVVKLRDFLLGKYNGLDVLINNAAMAYKKASTAPFAEQSTVSMATNFTGTLDVCNVLFPILRDHARVVHLSSLATRMAFVRCSDDIKAKILGPKTISDVEELMADFVKAANENKVLEEGWTEWGYAITKIGVRMMTPIQQAIIDEDTARKDIIINCCCPGFVKTNMTSYNEGATTVEQGADTPVYLATLPPNTSSNPRGKHVAKRKVLTWDEA